MHYEGFVRIYFNSSLNCKNNNWSFYFEHRDLDDIEPEYVDRGREILDNVRR